MPVFGFVDPGGGFWTMAVGCVCGMACALAGCYLLLRRLSMLGDGISHGVLPGIVLAVLATGQLSSFPIFLGAMIFGILTAALAQALQSWAKVNEDAALGVVFTSLFSLGVILISLSKNSHVDSCIYFGNLVSIPLQTFSWQGLEIPDALPSMVIALLVTLGFIVLLWKELLLATFDPGLARAMGFAVGLIHYLLIALVAGVTVTAFEAFGAVLVLAFLVIPAATAHLWTDHLPTMLALAAGMVVAAVLGGYALATRVVGGNLGGMMALVLGMQFAATALFAPRQGVLAKILRQRRLALRIASEEILAGLFRKKEGAFDTHQENLRAHGLSSRMVLKAHRSLLRQGFIAKTQTGEWTLTESGQAVARSIVRSHRLWESFLGHHFDLPLDHLHAPASRMEHFIGPELQQELIKELEQPSLDPHGRSIPPS